MSPRWIVLCAVVVIVFVVQDIHCFSNDDVHFLLEDLFTLKNYNKDVRPSSDFSKPTDVFLNIYILALNDIDEVHQKMSTTAYLEIFWIDECLGWNPGKHNGVTDIFVPQYNIWRPDFSLQNGFTKLEELGSDFTLVHIHEHGDIYWKPFAVFESKCTIDIFYFPFDKQSCDIILGTWMIELDNIMVHIGDKSMSLDEYQANDEWDVISTYETQSFATYGRAKVTFTINLKRKPRYYLLNIVVPILFLSILVTFTFVIPVDSGEKMGYTMTVYLAFAVFLTIISSSLPVSSDTSIMSIYLVFLLTTGTIIVMISGFELRIHHRDSSRAVSKGFRFLVKVAKNLRCQNCKRRNKSVLDKSEISYVEGNVEEKKDSEAMAISYEKEESVNDDCEISWPDVSAAIDFLCFIIFLFIIVTVTIVLFTYAYFSTL